MAIDRWTAATAAWRVIVPLLALVLAAGLGVALIAERSRSGPTLVDSGTRLGEVRLFAPEAMPAELVFLFSDRDGWTESLSDAADAMADEGAAVLGIDLKAYLEALRKSDDRDCHYLVSEIEQLSKQIEKQLGMRVYRWPILAGAGMGGTVAYGAAAQSPAATTAGALVVDPAGWIDSRVPLCPGAPAMPHAGGGFSYGPKPDMPGWLRVADRQTPPVMPWANDLKQGRRVELARGPDPAEALGDLLQPMIGYAMPTGSSLADLPLVELPAAKPPRALAVILSGDGGWRDLDKQIGHVLASGSIGVVGLDTLRYFWTARTPAEVGRDLDRIVADYQARWKVRDVVLIGYSFGADVLPAAIGHMAPATRAAVVQISLLGVAREVAFEFHVGEWLGLAASDAKPIAPDAAKLDTAKVQCVYGREEDDTLCRDPLFAKAERIETSGGHHFDGDYEALARRIIDGLTRRQPKA